MRGKGRKGQQLQLRRRSSGTSAAAYPALSVGPPQKGGQRMADLCLLSGRPGLAPGHENEPTSIHARSAAEDPGISASGPHWLHGPHCLCYADSTYITYFSVLLHYCLRCDRLTRTTWTRPAIMCVSWLAHCGCAESGSMWTIADSNDEEGFADQIPTLDPWVSVCIS